MSEWIDTTLGDDRYFKIKGSGINYFDEKKDYLSTSSVEETKITYVEQEITFTKRPSRANMQPVENSIWFAKMKNTLKVLKSNAYLINRAILSTGFCGIECLSVNDEYLKQFVLSKKFNDQKNLLAEGSTQEAVNNSKIKTIRIGFPKDVTEQSQIATILSTLDRAIASTEQLIAKYQRIKTGLLHDLLTRGIDEHGNLRSEKTHKFKDSKLGRIPVEWEVRKIEDVCTHIVDCPHSTPNYLNHGILIARTFSVKDGVYDINNSSYISEAEYHDRIQRLEPKPGDIIFTREAPVGESFVIPKKMKICLGQRVMLLRLELNYNPRYLLEVLYSRSTKLRFDNIVGGTTNPHLNVGDVKKFEFVFPRLDEQNKIDVCISSIRKFIDNNNINLTKLQSLKAGLMQDLLSGKVRVKI